MRLDLWLDSFCLFGLGFFNKTESKSQESLLLAVSVNQRFQVKIGDSPWRSYSFLLLDSRVPYQFKSGDDWQFIAFIPQESHLGELLRVSLKSMAFLALAEKEEPQDWLSSFASSEYSQWDVEYLFNKILQHYFHLYSFPLDWSGDLSKIQRTIKGLPSEQLNIESLSLRLSETKNKLQKDFQRIAGFSLRHYLIHLRIAKAFHWIERGMKQEEACLRAGLPGFSSANEFFLQYYGLDLEMLLKEEPTISFQEGNLWALWGYKT